MADVDRSLIPLPDGSLANTAAGARRILAEMHAGTLAIAQFALLSEVSALEAEIARLEREFDEGGENWDLFDSEIAALIIHYSKAITALETITSKQISSPELHLVEAEVASLDQKLVEIGDGEDLFNPKTAALIKHYIKALARLETGRRKNMLPSEVDSLKREIARLEEALPEGDELYGLFDPNCVSLITQIARAITKLGDVSYRRRDPEFNGEQLPGALACDPGLATRFAAEHGDADAQTRLGLRYANGNGVSQDYAEAVNWFRKAADQGHAEARRCLGYCHYYGKGIPEDNVLAVKLFRQAAEQGNVRAQTSLGVCYRNGTGIAQNYVEAVKWFRRPAEEGQNMGQYYLGLCYLHGQGVPIDILRAYKWFQLAADQGNENAKEEATSLAALMTPSEFEAAHALYRESCDEHSTEQRDTSP